MLLNPAVVLLGLLVGIFLVCTLRPEQKVVLRYPTPENVGNTTSRDCNIVSYKYPTAEATCEAEESKVREFPAQ